MYEIVYTNERDKEEEAQELDEPKSWTSLRSLTLRRAVVKSNSQAFWYWLWERCQHVKKLELVNIGDITDCLVIGMQTHMPHLDQIRVGRSSTLTQDLTGGQVEKFFSGCQHGWKEVEIRYSDNNHGELSESLFDPPIPVSEWM